jgi:hypothetical protein
MSVQNLENLAPAALDAGEGIIRLAPTWVPRSFLMPGARLKHARHDLFAPGTHLGSIDKRLLAFTTPAASECAPDDEVQSNVAHQSRKFLLMDAVGADMWNEFERLTVQPGHTAKISDKGATGVIAVLDSGRIGNVTIDTTVFIAHKRANESYEVECTGSEPLVLLRYFGPETTPNAPKISSYATN